MSDLPRNEEFGVPVDFVDEFVDMLWEDLLDQDLEDPEYKDMFLDVVPEFIREHPVEMYKGDTLAYKAHIVTTASLETKWKNHLASYALRQLMNTGQIEVLWCDKEEDFVFKEAAQ